MPKKIILTVYLLLFIFFIVGCTVIEDMNSKNNQEFQNHEESLYSYFPQNTGMHYQYRGKGIEYASFIRDIKHSKKPFVQIHDNNGGTIVATVYKVEEDKVSIIKSQEEFYSDESLLLDIEENEKEKEVILKSPIQKGTNWETNNKRKEIVDINMSLKVPAGRFYDVIKVKSSLLDEKNGVVTYSYYAQNTGLIKRESIGDEFEVISELETYGNFKLNR